MKNIQIKYVLLTIAIHGLQMVLAYTNECMLICSDDEQKEGTIKNPLDRYVIFKLFEKEECSISTNSVYKFLSSTHELDENNMGAVNASDLTIAIKFVCSYTTEIHFDPISPSLRNVTRKWNIVLIFYKCSFAVEEVNVFLTFGRIVMLELFNNPKIFEREANCLYVSDLQVIVIQNSCEEKTTNSSKMLFWDSCKETFSKTVILFIQICLDMNSAVLQERFPNLDILVLRNVNIHGALHFPLNRNHTMSQAEDRAIMNVMKLFFDFMQKSYPYYYLFSETSLVLLECHINQSSLYLSGSSDEIRFSKMAFYSLNHDLFRDVVVSTRIDLSDNNLDSVPGDLFQNQLLVKYLYLQNNRLKMLPRNIFKGLRSVLTIDISGNSLTSLHIDPFQSLSNIQEINLNNNLITYLPANIFKNQINSLRVLYLNSNPLEDIPFWPFYATYLSIYSIIDANLTGQSVIRLLDHLNSLNIVEKEVETQLAIPLKSQEPLPMVLLYNNQIRTIPSDNVTALQASKLLTLFSHFTLSFNWNPLTCNCDTYVIRRIYEITKMTGQTQLATLPLNTFRCEYPSELRGRFMWNITESDQYCAITMKGCPKKCNCFKRKSNDTIIVDCGGRSLVEMPQILPPYTLELWFENSNISTVSSFSYLENVTVLNLANNHIKQISASVFDKLRVVRTVNLQSNNLTYLPIQMQSLQLTKLTLSNNPFVCDCTMKWLKTWLLDDEDLLVDWIKVQCLDHSKKIRQLIAVPDSHFVCTTTNNFSVGEHVFLPSIIIASFVFVLLLLSIIIYVFRFDVKVLLFVYLNLHPFDKKQQAEGTNFYDAIVIYVQDDKSIAEVIMAHLRKKGYGIGDLYMHSFVGYTWIENIEKLIACSKSVILCMPSDSINEKIIQAAWNISYDKCMTSSISSLILVTDKTLRKQRHIDENLRLFIRSYNCVERHTKLLLEKVEYLVASLTPNKNIRNCEANTEESIDTDSKRMLVSYPD